MSAGGIARRARGSILGSLGVSTTSNFLEEETEAGNKQDRKQSLQLRADGTLADGRSKHAAAVQNQGIHEAIAELQATNEVHTPKAWFLLNPNTLYMAVWDSITACTLLFVSVFTPLEVAFIPPPPTTADPIFVVGRLVDAVFVLDMIVQMFLMIPKRGEPGRLENRWCVIFCAYVPRPRSKHPPFPCSRPPPHSPPSPPHLPSLHARLLHGP